MSVESSPGTAGFRPTAERPVRDGAEPVRSIVVAWDDEAPGLAETVGALAAVANPLGITIVLVSDHPDADQTMPDGVKWVPTGLSGASDEATRRRVGLAHTDGDVVVFVTERTTIPADWTTTWFGGSVRN